MRDGDGNKLTEEEAAKVKSPQASPGSGSMNNDSKLAETLIDNLGKKAELPETADAPKFDDQPAPRAGYSTLYAAQGRAI